MDRTSPDFSIHLADPDAPFEAYARSISPSLRAPIGTHTDLKPLIGSPVPLTPTFIGTLFASDAKAIRFLVKVGLLKALDTRSRDHGFIRDKRYIMVDPGSSLRRIYDDWAAELRSIRTHRDLRNYRRVRSICRIPGDEQHPLPVLEAVLAMLQRQGSWGTRHVGTYLSVPAGQANVLAQQLRSMAGEPGRVRTAALSAGTDASDLLLQLVPRLRSAPSTCYDAEFGEDFTPPDGKAVAMVANCSTLRPPIALYAALIARSYRRREESAVRLRALASFDRIFSDRHPDADWTNAAAVLDTLLHLQTDECGHRWSQVRSSRDAMAREWLTLAKVLRLYARASDPANRLGLADLVPAAIREPEEVARALSRSEAGYRSAGRDRRKARSDALADDLRAIEDAATLRMEQLTATCDAARMAASRLRRVDSITFEVETTVLDAKGSLLPGVQRCTWRAWSENALLDSLMRRGQGSASSNDALHRRAAIVRASDSPTVHYEFLSVHAVEGGNAVEPWFVSIFRSGVLNLAGVLPQNLQRRRDVFAAAWRLPLPVPVPDRLLSFSKDDLLLWRRAIEHRRVLVAIDNFSHAMRFAFLGLEICLDTLCRTHEFLQTTHDRDAWPKRPVGKEVAVGFLAKPKTGRGLPVPEERTFFPVSSETLKEMTTLCALTARRQGRQGQQVAPAKPLESLRWKGGGEAPYVFAFGGRMLGHGDMNRFLRFLLANVSEGRFHDLRHAGANALQQAGVSRSVVQAILNHRNPETTAWYTRPTKRQRAGERVADRSQALMAASHRISQK